MYLIDGYNLLHCLLDADGPFSDDFATCRRRMVDALSMMARSEGRRVMIYFDGNSGNDSEGVLAAPSVTIRYTAQAKADPEICREVAYSQDPGLITVISGDREVGSNCRREGARVLASRNFAGRLVRLLRIPDAPPASEKPPIPPMPKPPATQSRRQPAWAAPDRPSSRVAGAPSSAGGPSLRPASGKSPAIERRDPSTGVPAATRRHPNAFAHRPATPDMASQVASQRRQAEMQDFVQEMVDQIGPIEKIVREALTEPFPPARLSRE